MFNQDTFLDYLKQVKKKLGKVIMFTDRACQHCSNKVKECLKENKDSIKIFYFPKGSPD
jgi:transposase